MLSQRTLFLTMWNAIENNKGFTRHFASGLILCQTRHVGPHRIRTFVAQETETLTQKTIGTTMVVCILVICISNHRLHFSVRHVTLRWVESDNSHDDVFSAASKPTRHKRSPDE